MDILQLSLLGFVVFIVAVSKAGFGIGAAVLAVPLLSLVMPVSKAAAITLPILLIIDVFNAWHYRRDLDAKLLGLLLPTGVVGVVLGGFLFKILIDNEQILKQGIGMLALLFLLFQLGRTVIFGQLKAFDPPRWFGGLMGIVAGFTSTIAHAGGPPVLVYLLPQQLAPRRFAAMMVGLFGGLNLVKLVPYYLLGLLAISDIKIIVMMLPVAICGAVLGQWLVNNVDERPFSFLIYAILVLTAIQLLMSQSLVTFFLG